MGDISLDANKKTATVEFLEFGRCGRVWTKSKILQEVPDDLWQFTFHQGIRTTA